MADGEKNIQKRLHLSLRPQPPHKTANTLKITPEDIRARLTTFPGVSVLSVEGFEAKNGLGDLRGWGYVSAEGTTKSINKCIATLSGTTWKGAKIRIGDAKPDWKERLASDHASSIQVKTPKIRRRAVVYAPDMSLVTKESAKSRGGGWTVTPMGRVLWTAKMRPERPLSVRPVSLAGKGKGKVVKGPKRKRTREPDVRARRRKIDMTRWGSTYLSGIWLDGGGTTSLPTAEPSGKGASHEDLEVGESKSDTEAVAEEAMEEMQVVVEDASLPGPSSPHPDSIAAVRASLSKPAPVAQKARGGENVDFAAEKMASLSLLASMFGRPNDGDDGDDDDDWMGEESVGSDIDAEDLLKGNKEEKVSEGKMLEYEEVPQEKREVETTGKPPSAMVPPFNKKFHTSGSDSTLVATKTRGLKDLFAPKEEGVGFSLLDHLDLDLELDDQVPFPTTITSSEPLPSNVEEHRVVTSSLPLGQSSRTTAATVTFNPKRTLFFPSAHKQKGIKDIFDVIRDRKWSWRDPEVGFYRTETDAEIRARWEKEKRELTLDWKKRWREAGKVRRRRGGDGD